MQIAYVNVFVDDLNRAVEFYRDLLGFEVRDTPYWGRKRQICCADSEVSTACWTR